MKKNMKKLSPAQKAAKKERRKTHMTIFINGKQKSVKRPDPVTIDGLDVDEFIRNNADPIWLHQNGMHEELYELFEKETDAESVRRFDSATNDPDDVPF